MSDDRVVSDGCMTRRYTAEQVVCVECWHVREMRGETAEVIRRTRSEEAENAVLNAVRDSGVEPDWFVERWLDDEKQLVACAVFEDAGRCAGFRKAVNDWGMKLESRGDAVPVRLRSDAALEAAVAEHFSAEWERRRKEQMGRFAAVLEDAKASGEWNGRVVVGEYVADGEDGRKAFERIGAELNERWPHDENGEGGLVYSGFWDKGNVARFAFGFESADAMMEAEGVLDGIGARFYDPFTEDEVSGVELEMTALVIAKMQSEKATKEARAALEKEAEEMAKEGVAEGIAAEAERAMK